MRKLLLVTALALSVASPGFAAVSMTWVLVADAGNTADTATNCYTVDCGSVAYDYFISRYEVTNAQYEEFLNAKATSDPLGLYNDLMDSDATFGGITRSGSPGSYLYTVKPGFEDKPVNYVSFYDALRFVNWLNNGQGSSDTETGAYTITADGIANNTVTRTEEAAIFLPNEDEWYKAAYYDPTLARYFDYPTGTDSTTECIAPASDTGNAANCGTRINALTDVGAYTLSASPYGTFDQGGNVREWSETVYGAFRVCRGGQWLASAGELHASARLFVPTTIENDKVGFRVAPEPAHALLVLTGALVLAAARRQRRA